MKYLFLTFLFFYINSSFAQKRNVVITGSLVDSLSNSPLIDFSLTSIDDEGHQKYINYRVDKNGIFTSEGIKFKLGKIKISILGFESIYFSFDETELVDTIKLDIVYMKQKSIDLKEIVVKRKNKNIELDTVTYNFRDSVFNRSVLTKDVLNIIPNFKIIDGQIYYENQKLVN